MTDPLEQLKAASARLVGPDSVGTGYLVAPQRIATCEHVIRSWGEGRYQAYIGVDQISREAYVLGTDQDADCAIVAFDEPVDAEPLRLADSLKRKAVWDGYGYPAVAKKAGLPIDGEVLDPDTEDDRGRRSILLYSRMVAAGQASPLHGFSGSPVLVNRAVVGHFKKHLGDPDDRRRGAYGMVYACPIDAVQALLDVQPESVEIAPPALESLADFVVPLAEGQYHVFVNYRSTDRPFAMELVSRLEGAGFRVFIDQKELKPGQHLAQQLQAGLSNSRAAVVLVSRDWLASKWCQEEANTLLKRAVEDPSFTLIPLRLDDSEMPKLLDARVWLDFNGTTFEPPLVDRLLWGLVGQAPPQAETSSARVADAEAAAVQEFVVRINAAAKARPDHVKRVWEEWKLSGLTNRTPALLAAEKLIAQARPGLALEVLDRSDAHGLRGRQLRGLALSKNDQLDEAVVLLETLKAEGQLDSETGGILAGIYKKRWLKTRNPLFLQTAYDTYKETYNRTEDTYNGINVAALGPRCDESDYAHDVAVRVRDQIEKVPEKDRDHWQEATLGEAWLLSGRMDEARKVYRKAVTKAVGLYRDIAVMRGGARLDLEALDRPIDELDDVFPVPRVVAFVGHMTDEDDRLVPRFPMSKVGKVRRAIRERLDRLMPVHGFCGGARGSDLIFLEELLARGGQPYIILPLPEDDFLEVSGGGEWDHKFRELRQKVECEVLNDIRPPDDELPILFEEANRKVQTRAIEYASRLDETSVVIAVWDGKPGDGRGGTADAVARWQADGYEVDVIDPTQL